MMVKRILLFLLLALCTAAASAQAPLRLLVLPFDSSGSAENYGLGLATGIQRALNGLEGVFVPSVGDAALLTGRAADIVGTDALMGVLVELFEADAIVSGSITSSGSSALRVNLVLSGPRFPDGRERAFEVPAVSSTLMRTTVENLLAELGMSVDSAVQARLDRLASQAPTVFSLGPVGLSAARLRTASADLQGALELDPESGWVQSEYARALMLAGNGEGALTASERALELNPDDVEALLNHGIILTQLGRNDEAAAAYDRILELNSWHAAALTGRALTGAGGSGTGNLERAVEAAPRMAEAWLELVARTADDGRALQLLRRATAHLPESVQLHRSFLLRTLAAGNAQAALDHLRQAAAKPLAASPALFSLALELPASVADGALALVREGKAQFPNSSLPGLAEAQLLRRAGRQDEALTTLNALRTEWPDDAEVLNQLAITLALAGRTQEARELFESVSGTSTAVQVNLAQLLLQEGQGQAAREILEPLAASAAADADITTLYGHALAGIGERQAAETAYRRALELDPEWAPARSGLSRLQEQEQITGGQTFEMPAAASGAFERGLSALHGGDFAGAAVEFSAAVDAGGGGLAAFYRGYSLQMTGQVREAITSYEAAREELPDSDVLLNNLGYANLVIGRYDRALPLLRDAVSLNDGNAQAHLNLGLTFFSLSRYGDAVASWENALRLDPTLDDSIAELLEAARSRSGR